MSKEPKLRVLGGKDYFEAIALRSSTAAGSLMKRSLRQSSSSAVNSSAKAAITAESTQATTLVLTVRPGRGGGMSVVSAPEMR